MADLVTPHSSAVRLIKTPPTWVNPVDRQRLAAYDAYDAMYHNVDGAFALVTRGTESHPIYMPAAKTIIKTLSRYTAVKPSLLYTGPSDAATENAKLLFETLFKRERFWSKFAANKKEGIRRGDWLWHIVADIEKPQGSRISIYALDPRKYFKLTDPNDKDRVVGCDIVEQVTINDKQYVKRQRYTKGSDPLNGIPDDGKIWHSVVILDVDGWEDGIKAPFQVITPPFTLPDLITQLPVYHIKNNEETQEKYGRSALSGVEGVLAAITQATSDEEAALALEGLGMYSTDAGPPRDAVTGQETPWILGPGRVVERPTGTEFGRVDGIKDLGPYQDHLAWLMNAGLKEPLGITEASIGKVDATVAESGVALALQMSPTLAETQDNDTSIAEITNQMLFDLKYWFGAYEQSSVDEGVSVEIQFGDKLPTNRKQVVEELNTMYASGIIDTVYYRLQMEQFGYTFPVGMAMAVATERAQMLEAVSDPMVARGEEEMAPLPDPAASG